MAEQDRIDRMVAFKPFYDKNTTQRLLAAYQQKPHIFKPELVAQLKDHAVHHKLDVPEPPTGSPMDSDFNLMRGVKQMGQGFISGFTTFNVGEPTDNEYERIMRSLGSLGGFLGYIPSAPFKALGAKPLAEMARALKGNSVPLWLANKATKKVAPVVSKTLEASKTAKNSAFRDAATFLTGDKAKHVAEGAFNLGVASGIGSWQLGVNEALSSAAYGAVTGGVFRGFANLINKGGIPKLDQETGKFIYTATQQEDRLIRAVASSLYDGLQSTYRGETTPEQIYSYLLGAYFGANETTAGQARALNFVNKVEKRAQTSGKDLKRLDKYGKPYQDDMLIYDPRLEPGWNDLPKDVQDSVMDTMAKRHGTFAKQAAMAGETIEGVARAIDTDVGVAEATEVIRNRQIDEKQVELSKVVETPETVTKEYIGRNKSRLFLTEGESKIIKTEKGKAPLPVDEIEGNIIKLPTKGMTDETLTLNKKLINESLKQVKDATTIVLPQDYLSRIEKDAPETAQHLRSKLYEVAVGRKEAEEQLINNRKIEQKSDDVKTDDENIGGSVEIELANKSKVFVDKYLRSGFKDSMTPDEVGALRKDYRDRVLNILQKNTTMDRYEGFLKDITKEFPEVYKDKDLGDLAEGDLRQMFIRQVQQKPTPHFSLFFAGAGKNPTLLEIGSSGENLARNPKGTGESPKVIDLEYSRLMFEKTGKRPTDSSYFTLDHAITTRGKSYAEIEIKKLNRKEHWKGKQKKYAQKNADRLIGFAMREASERGYYYNGGKGDSGKLFFFKYHPEIASLDPTNIKVRVGDVLKIFKKYDVDAVDHYKHLKKEFVKKYKSGKFPSFGTKQEVENYFDKSFLSNLEWDKTLYNVDIGNRDFVDWIAERDAKTGRLVNTQIGDSKGFNKRNQIWMTDGFELDSDYFKKVYKDLGGKVPIKNNQLKYRLFEDADNDNLKFYEEAEKYTEATDGQILIEPSTLDALNKSWGLPYSGQNKSFIVDNTRNNGAFLGKMMFHKASPEASKWMRENNLHMLVPRSAAKEFGSRKVGELIVNDDLSVDFDFKGGKDYNMNLSGIKGSLSEKQTGHMLEAQNIPKQFMSSIIPHARNEIEQETIDRFFDELVGDRYVGENDMNQKLKDILEKDVIDRKDEDEIFRNFDKIGLRNVIDALKNPNHPELTTKLYQRILRSNTENLTKDFESGEIDSIEYAKAVKEARSFTSSVNRLMEIYPDMSIFLHKDVRNYLQAAMRNFVVNKVIRPKWDYSVSVRMRGYDPWLRKQFPELNARVETDKQKADFKKKYGVDNPDQLFYLDDQYKNVVYNVEQLGLDKKKMTLGELWNNRGKKQVKEFLTSMSLRVPMDSISGAHELRLAGFTGIDGHGAVFHPRTMRALGGADLDGDKAFVLFGMKKEYRDMYHSNKYEFRDDNGIIRDNKKAPISDAGLNILRTMLNPKNKHEKRILDMIDNNEEVKYQDLLTFTNDDIDSGADAYKSFIGKFTPEGRIDISNKAVAGRDQLGPAVIGKQVLNTAYDAALNNNPKRYWKGGKYISPEEYNKLDDKKKKGWKKDTRESLKFTPFGAKKAIEIFIDPRKNKDEINYSSELFRAQIAFGSDPLDELGLTGGSKFFNAGWHSLFKIDWNGNEAYKNKFSPSSHARKGLVATFYDFNNAYFSRNWDANRRWYSHEIKQFAQQIHTLNDKQKNTMLTRMVDVLEPIDYSDDISARIDSKKLDQRYKDFEQTAVELLALNDSYQRLDDNGNKISGGLFGRTSFRSPQSKMTKKVLRYNLFNLSDRKDMFDNFALYKEFFKGLPGKYGKKEFLKKSFPWEYPKEFKDEAAYREAILKSHSYRSYQIDTAFREGSHYLQNDAIDRASAFQILRAMEMAKKEGVSDKMLQRIVDFVQQTKDIDRAQKVAAVEPDIQNWLHVGDVDAEGRPFIRKIFQIDPKTKTFARQENIDSRIEDFKLYNREGVPAGETRKLTNAESYLFDTLMLSSYQRARNLPKLSELKEVPQSIKKLVEPLIRELNYAGSSTMFTKTSLNSAWTSDQAIRDFFKEYSKQFDYKSKENIDIDINKALDEDLKSPEANKTIPKEVFEDDAVAIINARQRYKDMGKVKLTDFERKMVDELIGHVNYYGKSIASAKNLNQISRALLRKDFDSLGVEDYRVLNNFFKDMRSGNMFIKDGSLTKDNVVKLAERHWMLFPRAISKEMMIKDFEIFEQEGRFQNYKGEWRRGQVGTPTHTIENIQYVLGKVEALAIKKDEDEKDILETLLRDETGYESLPDGLGSSFSEIVAAERARRAYVGRHKYNRPADYHIKLKEYDKKVTDTKKAADWDNNRDKVFSVKTTKGIKDRTGRQVANSINDALTKRAIETYGWIAGKHYKYDAELGRHLRDESVEDPIMEFVKFNKDGKVQYHDGNEALPVIDSNKFVKWAMKELKTGGLMNLDIGLDNLRKISRSIQIENMQQLKRTTNDPDQIAMYDELITNLSLAKYTRTGQFRANDYFPQFIQDKTVARKAIEEAIKKLSKDEGDPDKRKKEITKLILKYKSMTGDWIVNDVHENDMIMGALDEIANKRKGEHMKFLEKDAVAGNMLRRSVDLPGWSTDLGSWDIYQKNLIDTFYRNIGQIVSKKMLNEFNRKANDNWNAPDQVYAWNNFIYDYISRSMGFPSKIPEAWLDGPTADLMKVKGTPYSWFADNHVKDMVNRIRKRIGMKDDANIPAELQGVTEMDIRHWSNLEARYQMATLLAHPKSATGNIFGGTIHTIQSTGWQNFRNARNPEFWKSNIGDPLVKNWNTKVDIEKWAISHGVVPNFILYEAGLNPNFKGKRFKGFLADVKKLLEKDPMVEDASILSLARKHQIDEAAFQNAAWFMRYPERALRRDAFAAHYLQARRLYGHSKMSLNDPFLIEMAKKGVTATQFLYSAPYRPAFSATALGKVMTRFQTWAWNSVRFRNDINREARLHGYRQGTMEYDRFKRQVISDMFVLGLSNIFAYSLFETAMPQPYSWFQDTADWLFGNEVERDRAFFGNWPTAVAPLQMVTPPGLRLAPAVLNSVVTDDYSRLTEYYLWTLFPFGRIARDVKGVMENPYYTVEKATGIPYIQLAREVKKADKANNAAKEDTDTE